MDILTDHISGGERGLLTFQIEEMRGLERPIDTRIINKLIGKTSSNLNFSMGFSISKVSDEVRESFR